MNVHQYIDNPMYDIKEAETTFNLVINIIHGNIEMPYPLILFNYPIDNTFYIYIPLQGSYPTLGMILDMEKDMNRIKFTECASGTSATCIPK